MFYICVILLTLRVFDWLLLIFVSDDANLEVFFTELLFLIPEPFSIPNAFMNGNQPKHQLFKPLEQRFYVQL